jgi:pimeloyl-ACP methyl ester carboxylesterase
MSLNATIFPPIGVPTIAPDFNALTLGPDGDDARREGMQLYARLLDWHLDVEPAWGDARRFIVAHSFGGMLALQWLLDGGRARIQDIDGLILIATTAGPMYDVVRLRVARAFGRDLRIPFAPLLPLWNRSAITRWVKRMLSDGSEIAARVNFRDIAEPTDAALDLAGWRNTDWRAMRSYRLALAGWDVRARASHITVPTIVLHGTDDSLFPPRVARDLTTLLPNAELRMVQGAGHGLPLTHGETVREAVEELVIGR